MTQKEVARKGEGGKRDLKEGSLNEKKRVIPLEPESPVVD